MKIGIIGAGKVGTTLGKYLSLQDKQVTGYYSRTRESADSAATFTGTEAYPTLKELVAAADVLFVTTPDGAIHQVWQQLQTFSIDQKIICHFSGSRSSAIFSDIEKTGAFGLSIHPMYAFSDKFQSYQNFQTAYLTMEGDEQALLIMKPFWEEMGHTVLTLKAKDKAKYHAAAVLASNAMIGLLQTGLDLLAECGFEESDSMALLTPLVQGNVASMLQNGCMAALTGPIERNDLETVRKHLEVLAENEAGEVYRSLGRKLVVLAGKKHPEWDYTELMQILSRKF